MAGTLTRLEMQTEVLDNITQSADMYTANNVTLATMAQRWLNRAQVRISRMHNLIWKEYTSSSTSALKDYTFPSTMRTVTSVVLEDGTRSRKLTLTMPRKFDTLFPKPDTQSRAIPTIYVPYENTLRFQLFPIPDASYVMRFHGSFWPTNLSSDSQTSDYDLLDDVIIGYATMYGYQWMQEMADAKFWLGRANEELLGQINAIKEMFPDWSPYMQGFSTHDNYIVGNYYENPFVINEGNGVMEYPS